jgi:uncharacterized protein (DUF433 family)
MSNWATCSAVTQTPDVLSGALVFAGTRVPVRALLENLETGATIAQFVEWFPGVSTEQARQVIDHMLDNLEITT